MYKNLNSLLDEFSDFNLKNPADLNALAAPVSLGSFTAGNRFVIQPMEGVDGNEDGSPGALTLRRYERYAKGGAGLIWVEATAINQEARTSKNQLWIHKDNVLTFKALVNMMRKKKAETYGEDYKQLYILQLAHSGRFSKPHNVSKPIISYHNPYLNEKLAIDPDYPVLTDEELKEIEEEFVTSAKLAYEAGFDGVDIKISHRYLLSELTSAYTRKGLYGGSFENRIRLIANVIKRVRDLFGDKLLLASRLNVFDGIPYPYGFGVNKDNFTEPDYEEPYKLIGILKDLGVKIINVTMGSPYYYPHVNRPFDMGGYIPPEAPLTGVKRLLNGAIAVQKKFPDLAVVATGFSWLRQYGPNIASGLLQNNFITFAGFGRMAYAYPDLPKDILFNHQFVKKNSCITCSKCSELKAACLSCGCVVRDHEVYAPIYLEYKRGKNN